MSNFIGINLQQEIHDTLLADTELMGVINNVYDHLPKDASLPFVAIKDVETKDNSTKTTDGQKTSITIESWSNQRGKEETQQIVEKLHDSLHNASLAISGYSITSVQIIRTKIEAMYGGAKYKGSIELEIWSEKI